MNLTVNQSSKTGDAGGPLSINGDYSQANKLLSPVYDALQNHDNWQITSSGQATLSKVGVTNFANMVSTFETDAQSFNDVFILLPPNILRLII